MSTFIQKCFYKPDGGFRIHNFILAFYVVYICLALSGYIFIKFITISPYVVLLYLSYAFILYFGCVIGYQFPDVKYRKIHVKSVTKVLYATVALLTLLELYSWKLQIDYYGNLAYIFAHAYDIRVDTIGQTQSIIPVYLSYTLSLLPGTFCVSLVLFQYLRKKRFIAVAALVFVLVVINDLQTFGRVGILFSLFSIVGFLFLFKRFNINLKTILYFLVLFFILNLPRLIRGNFDNFSASVEEFAPFLRYDIPTFFYSFLTVFIYYFGSLFAFSYFVQNVNFEYAMGEITFNPILNIYSRFFSGADRVSLIQPVAKIPWEYNVFTIVKDLYHDFGWFGIVILSLIFGMIIGMIFRSKGLFFDALKIFLIAWVFFTPIYNVLSFAGFLISFFILIIVASVFKFNPDNIETV